MTWLLQAGSYSNTRVVASLSDEQARKLRGLPIEVWREALNIDDSNTHDWTDPSPVSCGDDLTLVQVPHFDSGLSLVESQPERRCWVRGWWNGILQRDQRDTIRWARVDGLPEDLGGDRRPEQSTHAVEHRFEEDYTLGVELHASGWPCEDVDRICDEFIAAWRADPVGKVVDVWLRESADRIPFLERTENAGMRAHFEAKGWTS